MRLVVGFASFLIMIRRVICYGGAHNLNHLRVSPLRSELGATTQWSELSMNQVDAVARRTNQWCSTCLISR